MRRKKPTGRKRISTQGFDETRTPSYSLYTMNLTNDKLMAGDWAKGSQGTGEASWLLTGTFFLDYAVPSLCESWELPDDETIIYHIRQGVHFHNKPPVNGREMTAHDVVYSLERLFFDETTYTYGTYPPGNGPISITALDDWTVEIKVPMIQQAPLLFTTGDFNYIVPQDMVEEYGDMTAWENSCGTGPFILTDYVQASSLTFERNPNYWMHNPLHPEDQLPYLDGVKWLIVPDASTSLAAFRTGKLERRGVSDDDEPDLRKNCPELAWLQTLVTTSYDIFMRTDKEPYSDIRVREALAMAIDRPALVEYYYEGNAEILASLVGPFPEFMDVYTPLEELPEETRALFEYNPDRAKELLSEAGYPDGFQTEIITSSESVLPIIKDDWSKIGVELDIQMRTTAVWYTIALRRTHEHMIRSYNSLDKLKINSFEKEQQRNFSMVDDPVYQEMYNESIASMLDDAKFRSIVKDMVPYILSQSWYIPMPVPYYYYAWWPWVKGYGGESTVGYYRSGDYVKYIWIDEDLRKEMTGR